ncbi:MAG TPA: DUF1684 domain-containing protein [Candidatus Krumholzibacteria bacterium]|nr:DUF1684 domain-containing protein [Candidatus Krumholzibacteria bacterium]HPD70845.1 DUF1684 domain-containing protein [Candidatus Krumholzibacteria bacterium]HRY39455.1 DUF1684 domain-containing protein [Candidatus Krumholzibacteria bacterium]
MPSRLPAAAVSFAVGSILLFGGCERAHAPGPLAMDAAETERWEIALVEWRIEKNERFMDAAQSPLPAAMVDGFEGLDYYFPVAELRYRLTLEQPASADTVRLARRKGGQDAYIPRGTVRFRHAGRDCLLTVFGLAGQPEGDLWLPFYDKTNGETTYPGGRYLDLELAADGTLEVDFNKAYNPLCAYDPERWNCTLPPAENTLPMRVEAGEKLLSGAPR